MRALVVVVACLALACVAAPSPGAVCTRDADCTSPLVCAFGRCRVQCRLDADCAAGQVCLLGAGDAGSCSLDTDLGCETGVGRACASGLTCAADHCLRTCASASECPSDGLCAALPGTSVSVCVDVRTQGDAGVGDAGPSDAGPQRATIDALCVGGAFACALRSGVVSCWGNPHIGVLGDGTDCASATVRATPAPVTTATPAPLDGVDAITCGEQFACAHTTVGDVWCWGSEDYGEVGDGNAGGPCVPYATRVHTTATTRFSPGPIRSMSAAGAHACVLDTSGVAWCWGAARALVDPAGDPSAVFEYATALDPALVPSDSVSLLVQNHGGCTIASDQTLRCWGTNESGRLGPDATAMLADGLPDPLMAPYIQTTPVAIPGTAGALALALAAAAGCMLDASHEMLCWGDDAARQLGLLPGSLPACSGTCAPTPFVIDNAGTRFVELFSWGAADTLCGLDALRHVQCWGNNGHGNAGDVPATAVIPIWVPAEPILDAVSGAPIVAGHHAALADTVSCVTTEDDRDVWCWGEADDGVLGDVGTLLADPRAHTIAFP